MEEKLSSLKNNIESLIIKVGGVKEYHAQILAGAIIELFKEEGLIDPRNDADTTDNSENDD